MPKVGQWLESHWVLVRSRTNDEERGYLDQNGHGSDSLYEAGFYDSEADAMTALEAKKATGNYSPIPLIRVLRDVDEQRGS